MPSRLRNLYYVLSIIVLLHVLFIGGCRRDDIFDAAKSGDTKLAEKLLLAGVDPNVIDQSGCTPLSYACQQDSSLGVAKLLISRGARLENVASDKNAIHVASMNGSNQIIVYLLKLQASLIDVMTNSGWTALEYAAFNGQLDSIKLLIHAGANPQRRMPNGWTSVMYAIRTGRIDVAEYLMQSGAILETGDKGALLLIVAQHGTITVLNWLLNNGASVHVRNKDDIEPIHLASLYNDRDMLRTLIALAANVNSKDNRRWTPLHFAALSHKDNPENIRVLLAHGAKVNERDDRGRTPYTLAIEYDNNRCAKELHLAGGHP